MTDSDDELVEQQQQQTTRGQPTPANQGTENTGPQATVNNQVQQPPPPVQMAAADPPAILQHVPFPPKLELKEGNGRKQDWETFRQIWDNYEISSRLVDHPSNQRTATLLTCFAQSALKVYNGLELAGDDKTDIAVVLQKMEAACIGSVNETYERYIFHTKMQSANESVDDFYSSLRELSKNCSFGNLTDTLIRDQIVVGVRDNAIRKRLLYEHKLTLTKCLEIARSSEVTQARLATMEKSDVSVSAVRKTKPKAKPKEHKQKKHFKPNSNGQFKSDQSKCSYCGSMSAHPRRDCPASGQQCSTCKRRGHFSKMCLSKKNANLVEIDEDDENEIFCGAVSSDQQDWRRHVKVDSEEIDFRIDTGADVSILPFKKYVEYFQHKQIFPTNRVLVGPGNGKLSVLGVIKVSLKYKDIAINSNMFVIHGKTALLSREDSVKLKIVSLIGNVKDPIFDGLGEMKHTYQIQLKENAKPFAVSQPRRVPIPLLPKLEDE